MPGFDQKGPSGHGPKTGCGGGVCGAILQSDEERSKPGFGFGPGFSRSRGFGGSMGRGNRARRGRFFAPINPPDEKSLLEKEKEVLKNQLNLINQRLEDLGAVES